MIDSSRDLLPPNTSDEFESSTRRQVASLMCMCVNHIDEELCPMCVSVYAD